MEVLKGATQQNFSINSYEWIDPSCIAFVDD
jgi:hypothetical protein